MFVCFSRPILKGIFSCTILQIKFTLISYAYGEHETYFEYYIYASHDWLWYKSGLGSKYLLRKMCWCEALMLRLISWTRRRVVVLILQYVTMDSCRVVMMPAGVADFHILDFPTNTSHDVVWLIDTFYIICTPDMLTSYLYMEMNHGITFNRVKDVNRRPVIWHLQMSTTVLLSLSLMFMYFFLSMMNLGTKKSSSVSKNAEGVSHASV